MKVRSTDFRIDYPFFFFSGFACPIKNSIQQFCCGTDYSRYCCSSDRYFFQTKSPMDGSKMHHHVLTDEISNSLLHNQRMINKQFEQFQRYFLPIFLLTTTILFLIGIALWFWLYKHKSFYSLAQGDLIESRARNDSDSMVLKRESMSTNLERSSRTLPNSSTEV